MKKVMRFLINPNHIAWQAAESTLNWRLVTPTRPPYMVTILTVHIITPGFKVLIWLYAQLYQVCNCLNKMSGLIVHPDGVVSS